MWIFGGDLYSVVILSNCQGYYSHQYHVGKSSYLAAIVMTDTQTDTKTNWSQSQWPLYNGIIIISVWSRNSSFNTVNYISISFTGSFAKEDLALALLYYNLYSIIQILDNHVSSYIRHQNYKSPSDVGVYSHYRIDILCEVLVIFLGTLCLSGKGYLPKIHFRLRGYSHTINLW